MASFFKRLRKEARRVEKTITFKEFTGKLTPSIVGGVAAVEEFVEGLAKTEVSAAESRLESARLKRLRQRGLINTIVTGRLGAPIGQLGLSTELGTAQRSLLGG